MDVRDAEKLHAITEILKKRFTNISVSEVIQLATKILISLAEVERQHTKNSTHD